MVLRWCVQVLQAEGLHGYVDPRCLQREIQEAADMTPEELDQAARDLIRRSHHEAQQAPQYYEHMGGYSAEELKDYNQYSGGVGSGGGGGGGGGGRGGGSLHHRHPYSSQQQQQQSPQHDSQDSGDDDDNVVQVTTAL